MKKRILITGTGGRSVGSGILHALLNSSEEVAQQWDVIAADADPFAWGIYKAPTGVLLPSARSPDYVSCVNDLIEKFRIEAVIPGTQNEVEVLLDHADKIPVPIIANRRELIPLMMDKFLVKQALSELGVPYIETLPLNRWKEVAEKYGFPLIVKPTVGTGCSRGLYIIADPDELGLLMRHIEEDSAPCVQPYIGSEDDEYTAGVLTDRNGKLIDSIVMKRKLIGLSLLRSRKVKDKIYSVSTGYSQGFIIRDGDIQSFCEQLALDLGSKGPMNIQLRRVENKIYVFEIHPRFSGTTPIRADVGFNEVDILLRNILLGEEFGRINYRYNVAAIRAFEHVIVPVELMLKKFN